MNAYQKDLEKDVCGRDYLSIVANSYYTDILTRSKMPAMNPNETTSHHPIHTVPLHSFSIYIIFLLYTDLLKGQICW